MTDSQQTYILVGDGEFVAGTTPEATSALFETRDLLSGSYRVLRNDGVVFRYSTSGWVPTRERDPESFHTAVAERLGQLGARHFGLPTGFDGIIDDRTEAQILEYEVGAHHNRLEAESMSLGQRIRRFFRRLVS